MPSGRVRVPAQLFPSSEISWVAIPEGTSEQFGAAVICVSYQPFWPFTGGTETPRTGGVVSMRMFTLIVIMRPAAFTARKRRNSASIIALVVVFNATVVAFGLIPNAKQFGIGGGGILVLLFPVLIARNIVDKLTDKKLKEFRLATRGAIAEEKVGLLLKSLGPDFAVLHDVVCNYGNIDHVVINKTGGIFMVEIKSHGGKITNEKGQLLLNGHAPEKDFIAQSLRNSYWLRNRLEPLIGTKPWITPILVFY